MHSGDELYDDEITSGPLSAQVPSGPLLEPEEDDQEE